MHPAAKRKKILNEKRLLDAHTKIQIKKPPITFAQDRKTICCGHEPETPVSLVNQENRTLLAGREKEPACPL